MLAANPIFPRPTFSASSAQLPSTSGLCLFSCSSAPPRSVSCQLSAVSSPASPFPATLSGKSQLIENPAALSPVPATLTRHVSHNPFVCHSYKKHRGGVASFMQIDTHKSPRPDAIMVNQVLCLPESPEPLAIEHFRPAPTCFLLPPRPFPQTCLRHRSKTRTCRATSPSPRQTPRLEPARLSPILFPARIPAHPFARLIFADRCGRIRRRPCDTQVCCPRRCKSARYQLASRSAAGLVRRSEERRVG